MDKTLLAVIGLRAAALALSVAGNTKGASALYATADLVTAGKATDAHMQLVADNLNAGVTPDWDGLQARIDADRAALHAP